MRILLVEDDPDARAFTSEMLRWAGHAVNCACHGADALRCLETDQRPDCILLDLMMPVMDGWSFRQVQRSDPRWTDIPVIVISAVHADALRRPELEGLVCVPKPIDLDELLTALDSDRSASSETSSGPAR